MKYFLSVVILTLCVFTSCVAGKYSNNLEGVAIDRNGKPYTDYIVKIANAKGEFISSHIVNEAAIGNVYLNGIKPGLYKITAICMKTSIEAENLLDYNGKRKIVLIQIPVTQYWLKEAVNVPEKNK